MAQIQESRETRLAIAILCLALALIAAGGGGILYMKDRQRPALIAGGAGTILLLLAVAVFLSRPSYAEAQADEKAATPADRFAGRNVCRLVAERSRVTVSTANEVPLDWAANGCVNGRTQYAQSGGTWTRTLVPQGEQAVAVLDFTPATGEYVVTRYLLDAQGMARVRTLRREIETKACTGDAEARTILADRQREIARVLPRMPNERLVYACENQRGAP
jgi:hypothetical protein